jgi:hypothetical protein
VSDAQELYEIASVTGWTKEQIDATPALVLDELRAVFDVNKSIDLERQAEILRRAIHGK